MALLPSREIPDTALSAIGVGALPPGPRGVAGTGWTAVEQGEGTRRRTILNLTAALSVVTTPDTAALADGVLAYTFPAGVVIVHEVYGDVGLDIDDNANDEDQPEIGLGFTIANGANATLGAAASGTEAENIWGPHVAAGCDVIAVAADAGQFISTPGLIIPAATVHTVFFNVADTWANGAGTKDLFVNAARFVIDWSLLPSEGV